MTLSTHIVTGATAAALCTTNPAVAFLVGMATHYALDMIPHWDYHIASLDPKPGENPDPFSLEKKVHFSRATLFDVGKVFLDVLIGATVVFFALSFSLNNVSSIVSSHNMFVLILPVIAGAFGGTLPDFLQFLYGVCKKEPLTSLQKIHNYFHAKTKLNDRPFVGVPIQVGIVVVMGFVLFFTNF